MEGGEEIEHTNTKTHRLTDTKAEKREYMYNDTVIFCSYLGWKHFTSPLTIQRVCFYDDGKNKMSLAINIGILANKETIRSKLINVTKSFQISTG